MYKFISSLTISSLFQGSAVSRSILTFKSGISRAFKTVNRRTLGTIGATVMLSALLTACGSSSSSSSSSSDTPPTSTATSRTFSVTTGVKTINFAWSAVSTATRYQLQSESMTGLGFTDLSTTGIVVSPNSTNIITTTAQASVALHRYIPKVSNPQYGVISCDATSCGASFSHNTASLTNAQLNSMIGRLQASNPGALDEFGWDVSLSGDGNTLAVAAHNEGSSSTGVNGAQDDSTATDGSGAVYIFIRIGGVWSQQAYIKASNPGQGDQFGQSISLSADGNTLAVGAWNEDGSSTGVNGAQDDNTAPNSGAVYVFRFSSSTWAQQAYIKASNTGSFDFFGESVSLSADGNTLAVGSRTEDSSSTGVNSVQDNNSGQSGAVYLFRYSSSIWAQQAYIKASNTGGDDGFGQSVSLSADGNTLAVGAWSEDGSSTRINGVQDNNSLHSGAVYVFRFSSSAWSQQAYIKASNTGSGDQFGGSVDLSDDGNTLAVGANLEDGSSTGVNGAQDDNTASGSGAVYVFRFSSSTWSQQAYIKASNTGANDVFGGSVSLSADGNTLAVSANAEDGSATGVGGADDNVTRAAGATYVFEFANGAWAHQAYIKATDPTEGADFGISVSLSSNGNSLAVGARGWGVPTHLGAVYLY